MKYACRVVSQALEGVEDDPEQTPSAKRTQAEIVKMQAQLTLVLNRLERLNAHVRLSDSRPDIEATAATEVLGAAKILNIPGDGRCATVVMECGGVKAQNPDAKLDLKPSMFLSLGSSLATRKLRQHVGRQIRPQTQHSLGRHEII